MTLHYYSFVSNSMSKDNDITSCFLHVLKYNNLSFKDAELYILIFFYLKFLLILFKE